MTEIPTAGRPAGELSDEELSKGEPQLLATDRQDRVITEAGRERIAR
jgi:hypothetical protein